MCSKLARSGKRLLADYEPRGRPELLMPFVLGTGDWAQQVSSSSQAWPQPRMTSVITPTIQKTTKISQTSSVLKNPLMRNPSSC